MSRPLIPRSVAVILRGFAGSPLAASTPFSLTPTFDVEIGNDSQIGPANSSATGTGMGIRNVATRRRVSYATYDISGGLDKCSSMSISATMGTIRAR